MLIPVLVIMVVGIMAYPASAGNPGSSNDGVIEYRRSAEDINELLKALKDTSDYARVPALWFGKLYNKKYVDIVGFYSEVSSTPAGLKIIRDSCVTSKLVGQQNIYLLIFKEKKISKQVNHEQDSLQGDTPGAIIVRGDTTSVSISTTRKTVTGEHEVDSTETINFKPKQEKTFTEEVSFSQLEVEEGQGVMSVVGLVRGLATSLGLTPAEKEESRGLKDTSTAITFRPIECYGTLNCGCPDSTKLYMARVKLKVRQNTVNGISIKTDQKKDLYARFGNYDASRVAVSIGIGVSRREYYYASKSDTTTDSTWGFRDWSIRSSQYQPFIFIHWYPIRPSRPELGRSQRPLLSVVFGTEINFDNFARNVFLGLALGDGWLPSRLYAMAGMNLSLFNPRKHEKEYKGEVMIAFSYRL